jgi:hypothetical protein
MTYMLHFIQVPYPPSLSSPKTPPKTHISPRSSLVGNYHRASILWLGIAQDDAALRQIDIIPTHALQPPRALIRGANPCWPTACQRDEIMGNPSRADLPRCDSLQNLPRCGNCRALVSQRMVSCCSSPGAPAFGRFGGAFDTGCGKAHRLALRVVIERRHGVEANAASFCDMGRSSVGEWHSCGSLGRTQNVGRCPAKRPGISRWSIKSSRMGALLTCFESHMFSASLLMDSFHLSSFTSARVSLSAHDLPAARFLVLQKTPNVRRAQLSALMKGLSGHSLLNQGRRCCRVGHRNSETRAGTVHETFARLIPRQ